jgi:amino acid transporter
VVDPSGTHSTVAAVILIVFLFIGFEWVTTYGNKREEYLRDIPQAMNAAIALLAVVYFTFAWAAHTLPEVAEDAPLLALAQAQLGRGGSMVALLIGFLAASSTLNAGLLGGARLVYSLARDGALPRVLSVMWLRTAAPVAALIFVASVSMTTAIIAAATNSGVEFAVIGAVIYCIIYMLLLIAAFKERSRAFDAKRHFRARFPRAVYLGIAGILAVVSVLVLADVSRGILFFCFLIALASLSAANYLEGRKAD